MSKTADCCIVKLSEPLNDSRHNSCIFGIAFLLISEDTMRQRYLATLIISLGFSVGAWAGDVDKGAVIGGAIGGGVGGGVGSKVGGTSGAVVGGAIGGAAGAAIGSSNTKKEPAKAVVQERVIAKEVRVVEVQETERSGPPGHRKGKRKGWQKHD